MKRKFVNFHITLLFLTLVVIISYLGYFVFKSQYFTIQEVKVFGDRSSLQNLSSLQKKHNFFLLNTINIAHKLQKDNPLGKNIVVYKYFPNYLEVHSEERTPVIAIENGDSLLFVDEEGFILFQRDLEDTLPIMKIESIEISEQGIIESSQIINGIQIVLKTIDVGFSVSYITVNQEKSEIIMIDSSTRIITPIAKDPEFLFSSLQLLLRQFRIEGKRPAVIDFRFDKPVVRFTQGE